VFPLIFLRRAKPKSPRGETLAGSAGKLCSAGLISTFTVWPLKKSPEVFDLMANPVLAFLSNWLSYPKCEIAGYIRGNARDQQRVQRPSYQESLPAVVVVRHSPNPAMNAA
jgi:hypothetical protein